MFRKSLPILFSFLFASIAYSDEPFISKWRSFCNCDDANFNLYFSSESGDPTEDDMDVVLISSDGRKLTIPIEQALYSKRAIVSDEKNICDAIGGFKLPNERVLLWFSRNNRPCWEQLSLVLIDYKKLEVIDIKENIGPIKAPAGNTGLTIRKRKNGYEVRLVKEWLQNTGTDSAENSIEDWMYIEVKDNKINYKWSA